MGGLGNEVQVGYVTFFADLAVPATAADKEKSERKTPSPNPKEKQGRFSEMLSLIVL